MGTSLFSVGEEYGTVIVAHDTVTPEYLQKNILTGDLMRGTG